jgi:hypothetical protein
MKMKFNLILISLIAIVLFSCKKDEPVSPKETNLISGETFNQTVLIDGHDYDNLIIENCTFGNIVGDGLQIRDVDNLIIRNCVFKDINGNAIRFRNSGSSNNVLIENNEIYNITHNGILSYQTHENTIIVGNLIHNIGTDGSSSIAGSPHHGIYFQGPNFLINNNTIYDVINNNGNCISVRSYGIISSNTLYSATKHGVSYYSDHPGLNGQLLVENNFIYDNTSRGTNLQTDGNSSNHIGNAIIRFNTIITSNKSCIGVSSGMSDVAVEAYGNILIRVDAGTNYVESSSPVTQSQNLQNSTDIGFANFSSRDLHITSSSNAVNFAANLVNFPSSDIDGENRSSATLDAGADEIN